VGDGPPTPEALLAEVVGDADGGVVFRLFRVAPERPKVTDHVGDALGSLGDRIGDADLEGVAREVAEREPATGAAEGLDLGAADLGEIVGVDLAEREQLRGDGALVLRPRPRHALAADTEGVGDPAREVVRVPVAEGDADDEFGVAPGVRAERLRLERLQFADAEVVGRLAEPATDPVGVADVVVDSAARSAGCASRRGWTAPFSTARGRRSRGRRCRRGRAPRRAR